MQSSHNNGRGRGQHNNYRNKNNRHFSSNYARKNRRAHKQATFDPSSVVIQSSQEQVQVKTEEYRAEHQFVDFDIDQRLKSNIVRRGYVTLTPIQDKIMPHILAGRDAVGIANTGTGKTAAFLIPLLDKAIKNDHERVLIIAPTRELAIQVRDELRLFANNLRILSTVCIGGSSINRQIEALKRQPQFVIGTPGRIKDLNQRKKLNFTDFTNIVLDEVDRMLDMGFVHDIRAIIDHLPKNRQSLFFSATMTNRVRGIMKDFLTNPVYITIKSQDTPNNVKQKIIKTKGRLKLDVLDDLLRSANFDKVLVFGRTKRGAENLSRKLQQRGLRVGAIHGNKSQNQRQRILMQFKKNQLQTLVATDVVARGLDIDNISHVINFDLPESYETYIHRIGRTGRADKTGVAITLMD